MPGPKNWTESGKNCPNGYPSGLRHAGTEPDNRETVTGDRHDHGALRVHDGDGPSGAVTHLGLAVLDALDDQLAVRVPRPVLPEVTQPRLRALRTISTRR